MFLHVTKCDISNNTGSERFGFTWWGWIDNVLLWRLMLIVIYGVLAAFFVYFALIQEFPVGMIFGIPALLFLAYAFVMWFNVFPTLIIEESHLKVRFFWRWIEVPWTEIVDMSYTRWPYHRVRAKRITPFHWPLGTGPFSIRPAIFLALGLKDRERLFWEIHRRASRAQGREVPVTGFLRRIR